MRRMGEISQREVSALVDGLDFLTFTEEGDYVVFAARYLIRESKGTRCQVFYNRYRALGGDPTYIRGQLYLSTRVPGHLPPVPNQRDVALDSDNDDLEGEMEVQSTEDGGAGDGPEGGDEGGAVPTHEGPSQTTPKEEPSMPPVAAVEGFQFPTGPSI